MRLQYVCTAVVRSAAVDQGSQVQGIQRSDPSREMTALQATRPHWCKATPLSDAVRLNLRKVLGPASATEGLPPRRALEGSSSATQHPAGFRDALLPESMHAKMREVMHASMLAAMHAQFLSTRYRAGAGQYT